MLSYLQIEVIVASKSDKELESLTKAEIYVFLKSLKDEINRRQQPRKRGKHNPKHSVLPIGKNLYEGARRLTLEWIRRQSKLNVKP